MIEGGRRFIATDFLDSEDAADDDYIDNNGAALDEEDDSGLGRGGM